MDLLFETIGHIELHDVEGMRDCFSQGLDPNILFRDEPLIFELTSEYTRSPRFKECVRAFVDHGLKMDDASLLAVLMDDARSLETLIQKNASVIEKKYSLRCAYTPMEGVSLLHICAEFNHVSCARILVAHGTDVNGKAGTDEFGFGGQTPIFHTVNQNLDQSAEMLDFLLSKSANLETYVRGVIWGKGYDWETFIPSVNPISYAMMGLLPQMHRDELTISKVVTKLMKHAYGINFTPNNIPNRYLSN